MANGLEIYSSQLSKEKDCPWDISYVSLTNLHMGSKHGRTTFQKKIDVLFETFQLLRRSEEKDILFGCFKGGACRKELNKHMTHEELSVVGGTGSFCIRTRDWEGLKEGYKEIWPIAGLGNLFLIFGHEHVKDFLEGFAKAHRFAGINFTSLMRQNTNHCDFLSVSYDLNIVDIYSAGLSIEEIESAIFAAAKPHQLQIAREKAK